MSSGEIIRYANVADLDASERTNAGLEVFIFLLEFLLIVVFISGYRSGDLLEGNCQGFVGRPFEVPESFEGGREGIFGNRRGGRKGEGYVYFTIHGSVRRGNQDETDP